jgi:hypothetical protein
MRKWPHVLIAALEALGVLLAIYFEPTYRLRGKLWGEAFFDGKPTSWWRQELERWEVKNVLGKEWRGWNVHLFHRNSTWFEEFRERWFPAQEPDLGFHQKKVQWALIWLEARGPRLLYDEDGIPVLRELLDDPSPKIRLFAQIGLKMNPKIPGDDED